MILAVVGAAGCNQVFGLEAAGPKADAAPIDGPGCSDGVFSGPMPLVELDDGIREFEPALRHDLLEVWFMQVGQARDELHRATRTDPSLPFGPRELAPFSSTVDDSDPSLTGDGLRLLFTSDRAGSNDVWEVTRPALDAPFAEPRLVLGLGPYNIMSFDISFDGLTIYFQDSNVAIDTATYAATRPALDQPFADPAILIAPDARFPAISPDSLELFFNPPGSDQLARRARTSVDDAFTGEQVVLLDSGDDPDLAADGRTLIVARGSTLAILRRACP